jgi:ribonuclease D
MAAMAGKLIHKKYLKMKECMKDDGQKHEGHSYWEWKPLSEKNLNYAILDGYITSELYRRISLVNQGQVHLQNVAVYLPRPMKKTI